MRITAHVTVRHVTLTIFLLALGARPAARAKARAQIQRRIAPAFCSARSFLRSTASHVKTTLVEVNYGPGEASPPHSHPCAVIGYVVEGAIRTQVEGEPEHTY